MLSEDLFERNIMIYVTSDLHGYPFEKFMELLKTANFTDNDFCFILGDVIDRGDDGIKYLEWLMVQPNVELLLGNHEAMMMSNLFLFNEVTEEEIEKLDGEQMELLSNWIENGGSPTLKALTECKPELIEDIIKYLKDIPVYDMVSVGGEDFFLSHSGLANFEKGKSIEQYEIDDFIWNRPLITDVYFDDMISVFGHTPTGLFGKEYSGKVLRTKNWIDVDTGVSSGYLPVLLRLDDLKEFYLN